MDAETPPKDNFRPEGNLSPAPQTGPHGDIIP